MKHTWLSVTMQLNYLFAELMLFFLCRFMPKTNKTKKTSHSQETKGRAQSTLATSSQSKESYNSDSARAGNMMHTDNSVTIDVNTADVIQTVSNSNIDVSALINAKSLKL